MLGVDQGATDGEIREAYSRLIDAHGGAELDGQRLEEVEEAYAVLSDSSRRVLYDATRPARAHDWSSFPLRTPSSSEPDYGWPENRPSARADGEPGPPEGPPAEPYGDVHEAEHHDPYTGHNPVLKMTSGLPRSWRITIDWAVTIIGAIAIVLAIKQWVINPYRIPSSSMEPTLHCARNGQGCEARFSDRVLANRFIYHFRQPRRGDIIVFKTPPEAALKCGSGGTYVKRLIGLPGETVQEKAGLIFVDGKRLVEPYVQKDRRDSETGKWKVPAGQYFFMGDNRIQSCDSREWGSVPRGNLIGEVFAIYWPPTRIGFR